MTSVGGREEERFWPSCNLVPEHQSQSLMVLRLLLLSFLTFFCVSCKKIPRNNTFLVIEDCENIRFVKEGRKPKYYRPCDQEAFRELAGEYVSVRFRFVDPCGAEDYDACPPVVLWTLDGHIEVLEIE